MLLVRTILSIYSRKFTNSDYDAGGGGGGCAAAAPAAADGDDDADDAGGVCARCGAACCTSSRSTSSHATSCGCSAKVTTFILSLYERSPTATSCSSPATSSDGVTRLLPTRLFTSLINQPINQSSN